MSKFPQVKKRDLKFRAWTGKKMIEVDQITFPNGRGWSLEKGNGVSIPYQPHITLMQYTGLRDKNEKEIYEGDILEYKARDFGDFIVEWNINGHWHYRSMRDGSILIIDYWLSKIIGNVYEGLSDE